MCKSNPSKIVVLILSATLLLRLLCAAPALAAETQAPEISGTVTSSQVSSFTGATTYNIPIAVPAGPGGLKPSISLQYNSVAVDESTGKEYKGNRAQLGKGWSLGGQITIQRDGWDEKFYLVMGGTRELLVEGSDGYYHPQKDNQARIKLVYKSRNKSYWQIYAKDGTYYELGNTDDSRHLMTSGASCEEDLTIIYTYDNYAWDVNLIRDVQGNQMVFSYVEYGMDGYAANDWITALKQIKYTLRGGSVVGKAFTVDFSLVNPEDYTVEMEYCGFETPLYEESCKNYLRYRDITVKVNGKLQRHYKINYSGDKKNGFKVASVTVYGEDNATAAPPVTFSYDSAGHIKAVNNGSGGKTAYTYETFKINRGSRSSIGSSLDSGLYNTRYRVSGATVSDGLGHSYTTKYSYSGARVSEDEYRGHSYVKATDALGNYTETWFYQDNARQGAVKQSRSRDAAGNIYGRTVNTFQTIYTPYANALKKVVPGGYETEYTYTEEYPDEGGVYYEQHVKSTTLTLYGIDKNDKFVTWSVEYDQSESGESEDYSNPSYYQPASTVGKAVDFSLGYGGIYYINSSGVIIRLKDKKSYPLTGTKFKQLAALNNAEELYAVDTDGNAWRYASGKWVSLKKQLKQIDAFRYTSGGVTCRLIYGIGLDDLVYRLENGVWTKTSTIAMKQVEIAGKAVVYAIGLDGRLYWYNNNGGWSAKNADLAQIAGETYDGTKVNVWGVGTDGSIDRWYASANYTECVMPIIGMTALQQTDCYLYDGDATYKRTQVAYEYDTYGNQAKVSNRGDVSVSGDEIYSYTEYINNTTSWILGVPKHSYVKDSAGAVMLEGWKYYSNAYNGTADYGSSQKYLRKVEQAAVFGSRGNAANPTTQTIYDQYGNVVKTIDALGNSAATTYDSIYHLFPVSVTNAQGQKSYTYYYGVNETGDAAFTGYGLFGQVKSGKDINGKIAGRIKYDVLGRTVAVWDGIFCANFDETKPGILYGYTYWSSAAAPNKVVTRKRKDLTGSAYFSSYAYSDGMGRTIQTQTPSEEAGKMYLSGPVDYDKLGRVAKQYVGYKTTGSGALIASPLKQNPTVFTYDAVGRVVRTDQPDGTCNRTIYNDYVTTTVDKSGKQLRTTGDAYGRIVKAETFTGNYPTATVYAVHTSLYDAMGRLTKATDAKGNSNTFTYDNLGRKVAMNDMDMGKWSYQYDLLGRPISQTDAKGRTIAMKYDALGRMTKKINPDGTYTQWDYDTFSGYTGSNGLGKLLRVYSTAMGQQPVTSVYYFDSYGREIKGEKTVDGTAYVSQKAYDNLNRVTYSTYPDGSKVYYTYNENNGGLAKIGSANGGDQYLKSQIYNNFGLLASKTLGNNVTLNYTYDSKNFRLTNVTAAGSEVVQNLNYAYDNSGLVTTIVDAANNTNWSYAYDDLHRLTGAKRGTGTTAGSSDIYDKSYSYDNIDNITIFEGKAYSYGDSAHKHAVTLAGSEAYAYDANGNLTDGAGRTIAWNYENRPLSVTKAGVTTEFAYDGNGTRVKKATGSQWKIYVGGSYEKDQDGKETCYIDAAGISVKKKADGSLYFILKDHLSGTSAITDAAGKVVTRRFYQPYGLDDTVGSFENELDDHKFTGQEEDTETGLYNYGARFYDPALGRFISADPLEGPNRYAYCGNNPANAVDPSGYSSVSVNGITLDRWSFTGICPAEYTYTCDYDGESYSETIKDLSPGDAVAKMIEIYRQCNGITTEMDDTDVANWFNDLDAWSQRNMSEACFAYQYQTDSTWEKFTDLSDAIIFDLMILCSGGALGGPAEAGAAIPEGASWFVKLRMALNTAFWDKSNLILNGGSTAAVGTAGAIINQTSSGKPFDSVDALTKGLYGFGTAAGLGTLANGANGVLAATYDWWKGDALPMKLATGVIFSGLKAIRDYLVNDVDFDAAVSNQVGNLAVGLVGAVALQKLNIPVATTSYWNAFSGYYCNAVALYAYSTGGSAYDAIFTHTSNAADDLWDNTADLRDAITSCGVSLGGPGIGL